MEAEHADQTLRAFKRQVLYRKCIVARSVRGDAADVAPIHPCSRRGLLSPRAAKARVLVDTPETLGFG